MKETDVYCSGFGFTKILFGTTELSVNEETLAISCSEHCEGFEISPKSTFCHNYEIKVNVLSISVTQI